LWSRLPACLYAVAASATVTATDPERRPTGRLRLKASLPSVARAARSLVGARKAVTALLGRAAACLLTGTHRDPSRLGTASAPSGIFRFATGGRSNSQEKCRRRHVRRWRALRGDEALVTCGRDELWLRASRPPINIEGRIAQPTGYEMMRLLTRRRSCGRDARTTNRARGDAEF